MLPWYDLLHNENLCAPLYAVIKFTSILNLTQRRKEVGDRVCSDSIGTALITLDMTNKTPEEYIQAMRTALSTGDFSVAQRLSTEAVKHYPDNQDIKKSADILAPATVTSVKRPIDRGWQKSREWVSQQRRDRNYLNQWVAVKDGELLATGSSIDDLVEQIGDTNGVLLTAIY